MRRLPIVIDTREQMPLDFSDFADVRTERRKLWPGDYSLKAATCLVAIERKSVSDLIGTMTTGYAGFNATTPKRFDCELKAMRGYVARGATAFVLVEPDAFAFTDAESQIRGGNYRSTIPPDTVLAFIDCIRNGWGVGVVFAESRAHAAEVVVQTLRAVDAHRQADKAFDRDILAAISKSTGARMD